MRKLIGGVAASTLVACGVFGSSNDPPAAPPDNTMAPAVGGPALSGLFVSASKGTDEGSGGTEDRPFKTLKAAFAAAKSQNLRLNVCAEEYAESVELLDGVSAYGNFDCTQSPWIASATLKAIVRSPISPALHAVNITLPTHLDSFDFQSADLASTEATDTVDSSIGVEVRHSNNLTISNSAITAGTGAKGADGSPGVVNNPTFTPGANAQNQNYRTCVPPAGASIIYCEARPVPGTAGGSTTCSVDGSPVGGPGGLGGSGEWWYSQMRAVVGTWNGTGLPFAATALTAAGGASGLVGAAGAGGTEGKDGVSGTWSFTANGFVRGAGKQGNAGGPGQGGGGGGGVDSYYDPSTGEQLSTIPSSTFYATATGAGGGSGGCGGQPGKPGGGGGASIGALIVGSTVVLQHVIIKSSAGGAAGKGDLGTAGSTGGPGGDPIFVITGGAPLTTTKVTGGGGKGGAGGNGGVSGHGAPGPSIAVAYNGIPPTMSDVTLLPGPGGPGQPALVRGAGVTPAKTLPAVTGESIMTYEIQ